MHLKSNGHGLKAKLSEIEGRAREPEQLVTQTRTAKAVDLARTESGRWELRLYRPFIAIK